MNQYILLCIPLVLGVIACTKGPNIDHDYYIQVFGKSYVCEEILPKSNRTDLQKCVNVLDSRDEISEIYNAVNIQEVDDLINK